MQDSEAFAEALRSDTSYSASLSRSMSLMLEEFYRTLQATQFSAITGKGLPQFGRWLFVWATEDQQPQTLKHSSCSTASGQSNGHM